MLPDTSEIYPEYRGQAIGLPALLDLLDALARDPYSYRRAVEWLGRWGLLSGHFGVVGGFADEEPHAEWGRLIAENAPTEAKDRARFDQAKKNFDAAKTLVEIEEQARLERIMAEKGRAQNTDVPLSPGGCPAAQELAEGTPASEGPSCESAQDGEGGGVIPSPPPEPEDDTPEEDDDGAWPIEDEADLAAPPPPCAADAGAPLPVIEGAPTPAETAPEAVPARERVGSRWTAEEDALALSLRNNGKSVRQIAEALGRSHSATSYNLYSRLLKAEGASKKTGMPGGERGGLQQHRQADDAPVQVGASAPTEAAPGECPVWWAGVEQLLDTIGTKGGWSAARDLALVDGRAKGLIWSLICDELGVEVRDAKARLVALTPDGGGEAEMAHLIEVLRDRAARDGAQ